MAKISADEYFLCVGYNDLSLKAHPVFNCQNSLNDLLTIIENSV